MAGVVSRRAGAVAVIPIAALVLWGVQGCSDDLPACAAEPSPALRMLPQAPATSRPQQPRYTYKPPVQQPRKQDTIPAAPKTKPTSWSQYKPPHTWGQPYGKGRPAAPQPTVIVRHQHEYRTYPGYPGYYPPGIYPYGYGNAYGCRPAQEGDPDDD